MDVTLTPELERLLAEKVASGQYATAGEVVRDGLTRLLDADLSEADQRTRLQAEIQEGLDELDRGEVVSGQEVVAELTALIAYHRKAR